MILNRKTLAAGAAALGLAGLAGGGIAWAVSDTHAPRGSAAADAGWCRDEMGMAHGKYSPMKAAAGYLGLSSADLMSRMHDGQSLARIASTEGKTAAGLRQAMLQAMSRNLAGDRALNPAQRKATLALMRFHLDQMIARGMSGMGHGMMSGMDGDDMGSMMGGSTGSHGGMMGASGMRMVSH